MSNPKELELTCLDCEKKFTLTSKERQFFLSKGLEDPKRCKACRKERKNGKQIKVWR